MASSPTEYGDRRFLISPSSSGKLWLSRYASAPVSTPQDFHTHYVTWQNHTLAAVLVRTAGTDAPTTADEDSGFAYV